MFEKELLGKSRVLASEHDIAAVGVSHVGVAVLRLCGEEIALSVRFGEKILKAVVVGYIQIMPVVQSGALELLVCGREPHRLYYMKPRSRNGARPRDISRILRYLRFGENYIELQFGSLLPFILILKPKCRQDLRRDRA